MNAGRDQALWCKSPCPWVQSGHSPPNCFGALGHPLCTGTWHQDYWLCWGPVSIVQSGQMKWSSSFSRLCRSFLRCAISSERLTPFADLLSRATPTFAPPKDLDFPLCFPIGCWWRVPPRGLACILFEYISYNHSNDMDISIFQMTEESTWGEIVFSCKLQNFPRLIFYSWSSLASCWVIWRYLGKVRNEIALFLRFAGISLTRYISREQALPY